MSNLQDFEIENGVLIKYNGNDAHVVIPDGVTKIGDGAFLDCQGSLTSICVPSSVTELGNGIFEGCSKLHYVLIPDSVKKIGDSVFKDCHNLSLVTNDPVEFKDRCGFFSDPNREILISVVIPNSVISIGKSAFEGCSNLESVIISDSVTEIGDSAFSGCRGLKRVAIPNSVKRIGCEAFSGSALYHVTIPAAAGVEPRVFDRCQELSEVTIHVESTLISADSLPSTVKNVNLCYSSTTKKVKDVLDHLIDETFSQFDIFVIETDKDGFKVKDGVLVKYYGSKYDVVIPDSVKVIQKDAFRDCLRLVSVVIPASVVEIDKKVFDCRPKPRIIRYY